MEDLMRYIARGLAALTLSSSLAFAQSPLTFQMVDTDGNGRLSYQELRAVWPDLGQDEFALADVDGLGGLTPDQLNSLQPTALPSPATMLNPAPSEPIAPVLD
jgi:hypothetical protein